MYYHGTNLKGILSIIESGFIGVDYFDCTGFYISTDINVAVTHGQYILSIDDVDVSKITSDTTNDGLLYKGKYPLSEVLSLSICNDQRLVNDIPEIFIDSHL